MITMNRNARVSSIDDVKNDVEHLDHNKLAISLYQDYFDAIVSNSSSRVGDHLLRGDSAVVSTRTLNSEFDFEYDETIARQHEPALPFHIAVCTGAYDVIKLFIQHDVDVLKLDTAGNSALHSLITCVFYISVVYQETLVVTSDVSTLTSSYCT